MDEEDFGEFGIAPKVIQTTSKFTSGQKRSRSRNFDDGPIPGKPVLHELIKPVKETIGIKLMITMGWRSGQGVGPRVTKKQKKKQDRKVTERRQYGCELGPVSNHESSGSENEEYENITFAPTDVEQLFQEPKDNVFGLGYHGLRGLARLTGNFEMDSSLKMVDKNRKVHIKGQAFGVGAFEEEDDDIYAREDMSNYDFILEAEKNKKKAKEQSKTTTNFIQKILEGFHLSSIPNTRKTEYPLPTIPPHFRPIHKIRQTRFDQPREEKRPRKPARVVRMTAEKRSIILEERRNEPKPQLSEEDRVKRLQNLESLGVPTAMQLAEDGNVFRPFAKDIEKQSRYDQYLKYPRDGRKEMLTRLQPSSLTEWEKQRERIEFDRASVLFKPLSGSIADRFVIAKQPDEMIMMDVPINEAEPSVNEDDQTKAAKLKMFGKLTREIVKWYPDRNLSKRFNIPDPYPDSDIVGVPTVKRNKMSIFNFLDTSGNENNIDDEEEEPMESEPQHVQEPKQQQPVLEFMKELEADELNDKTSPVRESSRAKFEPGPVASTSKQDTPTIPIVQKQPEQEELIERPPIDLFRAIFQNSDSESDDETEKLEEKTDTTDQNTISDSATKPDVVAIQPKDIEITKLTFKPLVTLLSEKPPPVTVVSEKTLEDTTPKSLMKHSFNPAFGLFKNIDLDALATPVSKRTDQLYNGDSSDSDAYTPSLPPKEPMLFVRNSGVVKEVKDDMWVEKSKVKERDKEKRTKKDKKNKHKKSTKRKSKERKHKRKHKRNVSSSSDTNSSSE